MRFSILCGSIAALAFVNIATAEDPGKPVKGHVISELPVYEAGDMPVLYVQLENPLAEVVKGYYANAEQMDIFPSDLVRVIKDGVRLPYARTNETHPRPDPLTAMDPGGTLTLEVPLDQVCEVPSDPVGRYKVQVMTDYYPGHLVSTSIEFQIVRSSGGASVEELLQRAGWQDRLGAQMSAEDRAVLAGIARRKSALPGLRARAIRVLGRRTEGLSDPALRAELAVDAEPIVAMAAISAISGPPSRELISALVAALDHRDLGVRRVAAKKLMGADLQGDAAARVSAVLRTTPDELVRRFLEQATLPSAG